MNPKGLFERATPESPQFTYDVFISYARADGKWIPKVLLPRLEKAGLTCAIDIRDFQPGVPSLTEISLANSYSFNGQLRRAVLLYEQDNAIDEKKNNKSAILGGRVESNGLLI